MAKVARGSAKIIQRTMELFGGPCKLNKVPLPPPPYTGWGRARHLALSRYRATEAARAPRTAKAFRECLGRLINHELNRENDVNAVMIAIELRRLVPVAIKPFSHCGHLTREIRRGKPNLHDLHEFASQAIALRCQNG